MNRKKLNPGLATVTALALRLMLILAPNAHATDSKWYVGAKLPLMFIDDTKSKTSGTTNVPNLAAIPYSSEAVVEYDTGFRVSGILGYQANPNIRVEGELFYGKEKVDKLTYKGVAASVPDQQGGTNPTSAIRPGFQLIQGVLAGIFPLTD